MKDLNWKLNILEKNKINKWIFVGGYFYEIELIKILSNNDL